jgi:hypothetical protein
LDTPAEKAVFEITVTTLKQMKQPEVNGEAGAMGYILMWLIGIPIPILLLFFLLRGCT